MGTIKIPKKSAKVNLDTYAQKNGRRFSYDTHMLLSELVAER